MPGQTTDRYIQLRQMTWAFCVNTACEFCPSPSCQSALPQFSSHPKLPSFPTRAPGAHLVSGLHLRLLKQSFLASEWFVVFGFLPIVGKFSFPLDEKLLRSWINTRQTLFFSLLYRPSATWNEIVVFVFSVLCDVSQFLLLPSRDHDVLFLAFPFAQLWARADLFSGHLEHLKRSPHSGCTPPPLVSSSSVKQQQLFRCDSTVFMAGIGSSWVLILQAFPVPFALLVPLPLNFVSFHSEILVETK